MCGCVKLHRIYSEWLKYRFYSYYDIMSTLSSSVISRMMWHGLPAASVCGGMSFVTTLPAPITAPSPIFTPGNTVTPAAIHTSLPMVMGRALITPELR